MATASYDAALGAAVPGYRAGRLLGRGRSGAVYVAEPVGGGESVALKIFDPAVVAPADVRSRLLADCALAAEIDHPNLLPILEAGEADRVVYVAMPLVEGSDLGTVLRDGPLSAEQTVLVVDQVAEALHAAHTQGLVHRDLRPSSVLLEAGSHRAYVADFGIGRAVAGAPYAAPEQLESRRVDGRADVYSLGRVLRQCFAGRELDAVVATALAHDPWDRYTTTLELAEAARQALASAPAPLPVARPAIRRPDPEPKPEPSRRLKLVLAAGAVALALGAAAIVLTVLGGGHSRHNTTAPPPRPTPPVASKVAAGVSAALAPVSPAVSAIAALPLRMPALPPYYDVVANSGGQGVRYRTTPDNWCGRAVPATDPCMQGVVPGLGAAQGQRLRVYCYALGANVQGSVWWAKVSVRPAEYIPTAYLAGGLTAHAAVCS